MKSEFDLGFRECEETKVRDLYFAIETVISALRGGFPKKVMISYLTAALKDVDE